MTMAGLNYCQTAQIVQENKQSISSTPEAKRGMPESSPLGPALFVDHMEECCSSLACEGLQGHQATPDEKAIQAEVKPCLTPAKGQGWKNICIIQAHSWISKSAVEGRN